MIATKFSRTSAASGSWDGPGPVSTSTTGRPPERQVVAERANLEFLVYRPDLPGGQRLDGVADDGADFGERPALSVRNVS
jgi:hypothetical protein